MNENGNQWKQQRGGKKVKIQIKNNKKQKIKNKKIKQRIFKK